MSRIRGGVATQLIAIDKRALFTHCYCHALNLAIFEIIKQSKICCAALEVAFEITKLVKFSPKRSATFYRIQSEEEDSSSIGIRIFCPKRWTVRVDLIESILSNYDNLKQLWEEYLGTSARCERKGTWHSITNGTLWPFVWTKTVSAHSEDYKQLEQDPSEKLLVCRWSTTYCCSDCGYH